MAFVKVDETEPLEKAIKRFKRMVEKEGVIRDYKMRRYFEKPSAIQHRKNKAMARKQMLKNKKMHASKAYCALLTKEALGYPGVFLILVLLKIDNIPSEGTPNISCFGTGNRNK